MPNIPELKPMITPSSNGTMIATQTSPVMKCPAEQDRI
jgi:hypothetical protein